MRQHTIRKGSNHFGKKITFVELWGSSGRLRGSPGEAPGRPRGGSEGSVEARRRLWDVLGDGTRVQKSPKRLREAPGRPWGSVLEVAWRSQEAMFQAFWGHLGVI